MPELPEVETIACTLRPKAVGRRIAAAEVFLPKVIKEPDAGQFVKTITGLKITGLKRRGKFLLFYLSEAYILVIHLRMTGRLVYVAPETPREKHTHVIFHLDDGNELRFQDLRQFGTMHLLAEDQLEEFPSLSKLGPDTLDSSLTRDVFKKMLKGRSGKIKKLLLDQTFISGIGNIYANEILWEARIHPERQAATLNPREISKLYKAMRDVLKRAIAYRGTTLRDYVDGEGKPGGFQTRLAVHGRENQPCPACGSSITRVKSGGRSSYICPCCQKS